MERKPMHVRVREQAAQSPSLQSRINPPEGWRFVRVETTEHKWSQLDDDAELRWREVARKWRLVIEATSIDTLELEPLPVAPGDIVHRPADPVCPVETLMGGKILTLTTRTMTRDGQLEQIIERSQNAHGAVACRLVTADGYLVSDDAWVRDAWLEAEVAAGRLALITPAVTAESRPRAEPGPAGP